MQYDNKKCIFNMQYEMYMCSAGDMLINFNDEKTAKVWKERLQAEILKSQRYRQFV